MGAFRFVLLAKRALAAGVLFAAGLPLVGCTTNQSVQAGDLPAKLKSPQVIALIFSQEAGTVEHEASSCIEDAVQRGQLNVRIVSPEEFRRTAFPDLPPEAAVHSSEYLALLAAFGFKATISDRVTALAPLIRTFFCWSGLFLSLVRPLRSAI